VLPRHISLPFPLPKSLHLYLRILHIFDVCNLLAYRSLINFLACSPHFCILVSALSPSCPQICRTLPTMGLGPTRWMLHLPSACCLIPMRDLVALRLGKFFFFPMLIHDGDRPQLSRLARITLGKIQHAQSGASTPYLIHFAVLSTAGWRRARSLHDFICINAFIPNNS
jgi:hypothetical protein